MYRLIELDYITDWYKKNFLTASVIMSISPYRLIVSIRVTDVVPIIVPYNGSKTLHKNMSLNINIGILPLRIPFYINKKSPLDQHVYQEYKELLKQGNKVLLLLQLFQLS